MKLREFVQDIKKNVFMKGNLKKWLPWQQEGCACKSLKSDKSRWVSNMKKLFIPVDRSYKEKQFMYETFFPSIFTSQNRKHRNA